MDHNSIRHKLSEYIDGTVSPEERSMIEEHLKTCEKCSDALTELNKTIEHVKSIDAIEPPVWMTQKIMSKVRAEAEGKKTIFQRLFYPLAVKLPVQALAVLFLTITAYYVYQNINPADRYTEAPRVATAKKEVSISPARGKDEGASVTKKDALDKMQSSTQRSKQVPQSPEYKALDMKQEYEKPAPPALEDKAAAPTKAAEQPMFAKKEATMEKRAVVPQTGASATVEEQAAPSARMAPRSEVKQKTASALKAETAGAFDKYAECLAYEPNIISVSGIIKKIDFPGPPNYESIAKGDKRETYWILKLDKAVCVSSDKNNDIKAAEANVIEMQLVLGAAKYDTYRDLLSSPVIVRGTLFHAISGHHHTSVLLKVNDITSK